MSISATELEPQRLASERGAVMIVTLIMLLVLTLLGTAAARMALMEERMTGNTQDRNVAFEAAEAALRDGEEFLEQAVLPAFDGTNGLYVPAPPTDPPLWRTVSWNSAAAVRAYAGLAGAPGILSRATPRYFIEELPRVTTPGESVVFGSPVDEPRFYRVTARATGAAGNATVVVQSTYKR